MKQQEEITFLALIGIFDYKERGMLVSLDNILDDMYDSIYYMLCRDIKTGEIKQFFTNCNGKNEMKKALVEYYQTGRLLFPRVGEGFSLEEFYQLQNFYYEMKKIKKEPTIEQMNEQVDELYFKNVRNKAKTLLK